MILPLYYNWRNLLARKLSTSLMLIVVGVVVFVLSLLLSFAAGMRGSLVASGSPMNVIVLKPGATAESTSIIRPEEFGRIMQTPGVGRQAQDMGESAAGSLLISPELCVQTTIRRQGGEHNVANVAVRGVDDVAFAVHAEVQLVEGRQFKQGTLEAIVGRAACDRFTGLKIGDTVPLGRTGNRVYTIVGVFTAAGGALESEIWTPRTILTDSYMRHFMSSVCLRLADPALAAPAIDYVNGPVVQLEGRRETTYYEELASKTREIVGLSTVLVGIMAVGAVFAVANTMYSAVDGRRRELAMLRTIGFGRGAIMLAIVLESMLLCALACLAGLAGSSLLSGVRQDFLSDTTWTVLAFELRLTPAIALIALGAALLVGVGGALAPAVRAARINILQAVRKG